MCVCVCVCVEYTHREYTHTHTHTHQEHTHTHTYTHTYTHTHTKIFAASGSCAYTSPANLDFLNICQPSPFPPKSINGRFIAAGRARGVSRSMTSSWAGSLASSCACSGSSVRSSERCAGVKRDCRERRGPLQRQKRPTKEAKEPYCTYNRQKIPTTKAAIFDIPNKALSLSLSLSCEISILGYCRGRRIL